MIIIENIKRLYGLLKHCLFVKSNKKIDNFNNESLDLIKKGITNLKLILKKRIFIKL